jgi:hypothetical protein
MCSGLSSIASESGPWAFSAPSTEGYSIDLVSAEPAPGTPLADGSTVTFRVSVKYTLKIANSGTIILIFQDETDRDAKDNTPQVGKRVEAPYGTQMLTDTLIVPHANEVLMFITFVPNGVGGVTGAITIRYPVVGK